MCHFARRCGWARAQATLRLKVLEVRNAAARPGLPAGCGIRPTQREMVYIDGGSGMAPLRSHITHLFETQATARKVSFWYGARFRQDVLSGSLRIPGGKIPEIHLPSRAFITLGFGCLNRPRQVDP